MHEIATQVWNLTSSPVVVPELATPTLEYTTKSGPNGTAILTAWTDLAALKKEPQVLRHLWTYLQYIPKQNLQKGEVSIVDNILKTIDEVVIPHHRVSHSRLSVKRELGGKDRVFALSDYYTKMALKPLHTVLAKILEKIPQDYTFDQDRAAT